MEAENQAVTALMERALAQAKENELIEAQNLRQEAWEALREEQNLRQEVLKALLEAKS